MLIYKELVFFLIFYIIPAVILTGLLFICKKISIERLEYINKWNLNQFVKLFVFNTLWFYFASVLIKSLTGNGYQNFSKTVEIATISTYKHYLIINIVIIVFSLIVIAFLLKNRTEAIVNWTLSTSFGILLVLYVFNMRSFLNIEVCFAFIAGIVVGLGIEIGKRFNNGIIIDNIISHVDSLYVMNIIYKDRVKKWLPICLFCGFLNYFFVPMKLYLTNIDEFRIRGPQLILISIIPIAVWIIVSTIVLLFLSENAFKVTNYAIFGISLMKYVQEFALNGRMKSMEGFSQVWNASTKFYNNIIWVVVVLLVILLGIIIKKVSFIYDMVSGYFLMIIIATVAYMFVTTEKPNQIGLTAKGVLDVSDKNNTIVFILDKFDSQFFERIVAESPEFIEPLADFTYYPDITGAWTYTDRSIPYLLSDVDGLVGVTPTESKIYSFSNSSLLEDFVEAGYSLGVYTDSLYLVSEKAKLFVNYDATPQLKINIGDCITTMMRMTQYSCMPFSFKHKYSYSDMDCLMMADFDGVWKCSDDTIFYQMLSEKGLSISENDNEGSFIFIHLNGAHQPYIMNEDCQRVEYSENEKISREACDSQAKGSLKIVYKYIEELKELGVYDNSTILIIADHGQNFTLDSDVDYIESLDLVNTCRPLCLCKMPGARNDSQNITVSEGTCTQAELIETVRESILRCKLDNRKRLDEALPGDYSERKTTRILQTLGEATEYVITGDARDEHSWKAYEPDFEVVLED